LIKVVSVEQMRRIEQAADAAGIRYDTMMERAGRATAMRAIALLKDRQDARVTVLVGPGNNGGDGLVAGRIIAQESEAQVRFYLLKERDDAHFTAARDAGLFIATAENDRDFRVLRNMVASADLVVDALFGIGARLPMEGEAAKLLRAVNQALHNDQLPETPEGQTIDPAQLSISTISPYVLAVDCPSGLNCDTGELDPTAIHADETMTFIAAKPGLFSFPGAAAVGDLRVANLGIPEDTADLKDEARFLVDANYVYGVLPERPADANKGTFGKALIIAGSSNYTGAAGLSALAAYRAGAGLVTVGAPGPVVGALSGHILEPTWLLLPHDMGALAESAAQLIYEQMEDYTALLLGSGWGREATTKAMLMRVLDTKSASPQHTTRVIGFGGVSVDVADEEAKPRELPPLVIDADGLNLLSEIENWHNLLPPDTILTPHPGEMGRLAKLKTSEVQADRWGIASAKAQEWNVILVLKGAHTLVAEPGGRVAVLPVKTDALATAGTGDVLAGLITGLRAAHMSAFDAAVAGAYLHGLAGLLAAKRIGSSRSVIAGDVLAALLEAFAALGG
jgi:NAD(P)H-hydrate epimerase